MISYLTTSTNVVLHTTLRTHIDHGQLTDGFATFGFAPCWIRAFTFATHTKHRCLCLATDADHIRIMLPCLSRHNCSRSTTLLLWSPMRCPFWEKSQHTSRSYTSKHNIKIQWLMYQFPLFQRVLIYMKKLYFELQHYFQNRLIHSNRPRTKLFKIHCTIRMNVAAFNQYRRYSRFKNYTLLHDSLAPAPPLTVQFELQYCIST